MGQLLEAVSSLMSVVRMSTCVLSVLILSGFIIARWFLLLGLVLDDGDRVAVSFLAHRFTLIGKSDPLAFYFVVTVVGVLGELPGARSPTPLFPCDGASGGLWLLFITILITLGCGQVVIGYFRLLASLGDA